jgi:signal transduction histidine kinase
VVPSIRAPRVMGDAIRLQQVIWNLLTNAVKFTAPGGEVRAWVRHQGEEVVLTVSDTGRGIDPAFLPHVFDMFRQADPINTRTFPGLGIGLSIVRRLVELHGGHVAASSDGVGRGATFTVSLPRQSEAVGLGRRISAVISAPSESPSTS